VSKCTVVCSSDTEDIVLLVHQFDALSLAFVYFKTEKNGSNSVTVSLHEWSVFAKILYHWVSHMFSYFCIGNKTVVGLGYSDDACASIKALWDIFLAKQIPEYF